MQGGAQLLAVGRRAARLREGGRKGGDAARTRARKHWRHGGGTAGADGDARRGGAGAAGAGSRPNRAGWRPIAAPATTRARPGCTRRYHDGTPGRRARNGRTVTTRADRPTAGAEPGGHPPAARTACRRSTSQPPADAAPTHRQSPCRPRAPCCRLPPPRALIFTPAEGCTADAPAAAQRTTQPAAQLAAQLAAQRKPLYMRPSGKGATQQATQQAAQAAAQAAAHLYNNE